MKQENMKTYLTSQEITEKKESEIKAEIERNIIKREHQKSGYNFYVRCLLKYYQPAIRYGHIKETDLHDISNYYKNINWLVPQMKYNEEAVDQHKKTTRKLNKLKKQFSLTNVDVSIIASFIPDMISNWYSIYES